MYFKDKGNVASFGLDVGVMEQGVLTQHFLPVGNCSPFIEMRLSLRKRLGIGGLEFSFGHPEPELPL